VHVSRDHKYLYPYYQIPRLEYVNYVNRSILRFVTKLVNVMRN
jgi:hypothetical protein